MNDDLISKRLAVEAIESIRGYIWDVDIPSPTVPEYVEHHEQMQGLMRKCDAWLSIIEREPAAQPIIHCGTCKWFQCNMRPDGYLPKGVDEFECRHWCGPCDPVDFCSHAERRTDGVDS